MEGISKEERQPDEVLWGYFEVQHVGKENGGPLVSHQSGMAIHPERGGGIYWTCHKNHAGDLEL